MNSTANYLATALLLLVATDWFGAIGFTGKLVALTKSLGPS